MRLRLAAVNIANTTALYDFLSTFSGTHYVTPQALTAEVPGITVYSATKAAVRSFARTLANELRDRRIRVNTLSPGHIDTPLLEQWQQGEALIQLKEAFARKPPLG